MASINKKKKGKNSFLANLGLKNDNHRLKRLRFFTPSERYYNKKQTEKEVLDA